MKVIQYGQDARAGDGEGIQATLSIQAKKLALDELAIPGFEVPEVGVLLVVGRGSRGLLKERGQNGQEHLLGEAHDCGRSDAKLEVNSTQTTKTTVERVTVKERLKQRKKRLATKSRGKRVREELQKPSRSASVLPCSSNDHSSRSLIIPQDLGGKAAARKPEWTGSGCPGVSVPIRRHADRS